MPKAMIDETDNRYGSLTVIKQEKDKNGRSAWLCQCDCGNTKIVRGPDLRAGKITHCSRTCPCKVSSNFIDETGKIYGFLTVINKSPIKSNSNKTLWHCKCECGNEIDVLGESLRQGLTKSCGCQTSLLKAKSLSMDLKGQKFGFLIPIEILEYGNGHGKGNDWVCECTCGCGRKDVIVPTSRLTSGHTQSCGRIKKSHGEISIENFLKENKISYKTEFTFNDFYIENHNNIKFRYDFAIFKNDILYCLIEYDGEQHFNPIAFFGGEEEFQKRQKYDTLKNEYCIKNNIKLIRIRYDEDVELKLEKELKELICQ